MKCKNCGTELEANQTVCHCCKEPAAAPKKEKKKIQWTKKNIIKLVVAIVAGLLVLSLVAGILVLALRENDANYKSKYTTTEFWSKLTRDQVVATMGEYELTNSQLQVFFWMQFYEMVDYYGDYAEYYLGVDLDKPLYEQQYKKTDMNWEQYMLGEAIASWHRYQAAAAEADKAGYKMPQEYQENFAKMKSSMQTTAKEQGYVTVEDMLEAEFGAGVDFDDYYNYLWIRYTAELYFSDVIANLKFTDAELDEFFHENEEDLNYYGVYQDDSILVDFRNILVKPVSSKDDKGNTVFTEEAWKTCLDKAQAIFETLLEDDNSETTFAAMAKLKSEDKNSSTNGGLNQYVAKNSWTTVDVRHILIMPSGGTKVDGSTTVTYSEEEWEACRVEAQLLLDEYLAGEQTAEAFGAMANKYSQDQNGKVTNGGLYEDVYQGQMVKAFDAWIFDSSRVSGDTGLVKTEYGYHVMYFVSRNGPVDDWAFSAERQPGDMDMIKTEDGYQILYYVGYDIAWEVWCEEGLITQTSQELMESYTEKNPIEVKYWAIMFSERPM